MTSSREIERSLAGLAASLRADGYELQIEEVGAKLRLRVNAGEDACAECLVPPPVLTRIVSAALDGAYPPERIVLTYPDEGRTTGHATA